MVVLEIPPGLELGGYFRVKLHLRKANGFLIPDSPEDAERLIKFKFGEVIKAEVTRPRNYKFHRKMFSLFQFCYENWEQPEVDTPHGVAGKSFDRFWRDLVILAGYYEQVVRVDGSVRVEAKSIAFANMDEDEFGKLYSAVVDAAIKHVLKTYTRDDVDRVMEQVLSYAA